MTKGMAGGSLSLGDMPDGKKGKRDPWPLGFALILFSGCFASMTWPWLSGRVTIPWDAKAHFQPQIQFLAGSIARGEWPFWNPYAFSGHPQIADPQSMIFSPPFLALALVDAKPSLWAVDVTLLAAICAGGMALIVWFRDQGWHWAGAILAAIAFSFGAAMAWRIQHITQVLSLAYLPFALLCLDRALSRGSLVYGIAAGVVGGFIVLGRDQVALLCVYLLTAYALWRLIDAETDVALGRRLLSLAAGGLAGFIVAAVPVTLTFLLAAQSNRPGIDYIGAGRGSLHPALLLTFLMPDLFGAAGDMRDYWGPPSFAWKGTDLYIAQNVGELYIGAIPLLLTAGALLTGRLWAREVCFFVLALAIVALYALGWYTPAFRLMYEALPGVKLYRRPADAVFLMGALAAILAGYAAHLIFTEPWKRPTGQQLLVLAGLATASFAIAALIGWRLERASRLASPMELGLLFLGGGALVIAWAWRRAALEPRTAAVAIIVFAAADLAWNNGPNTSSALPPTHYEVLEPDSRNETIAFLKAQAAAHSNATRRDRIELAGLGFHWPNASITHGLENTLGYNPLRLGLYSRATGAEDHVGLPDQRKFSALMPSYKSRLSDMLGLRYIAAGVPIEQIDKRLAPGTLPLIARTADAYIYENRSTFPRVLFANSARRADFAAILQNGVWPEFDPATTVLLAQEPSQPTSHRAGTATLRAYSNTEVTIEVASLDGGWVILNDVWHPWWFATVGRQPAPVLRANVLFRAVEVPPGTHTVRFAFEPLRGAWAELRHRRP